MAREFERPARGNAGAGRSGGGRNNADRPQKDSEGKKIFNRRDKYERNGEEREGRERRSFDTGRRDERRGERREGGSGRPAEGDRIRRYDREGSDRRSFNSDRPRREQGSDRRSFASERGEQRGGGENRERRPFSSDRPRREDGERRSFGAGRREGGQGRSFDGDRAKRYDRAGGERRSFDGDRTKRYDREGGERRAFSTDRSDRRENDRRSFNTEGREERRGNRYEREGKPSLGERRSFERDKKPFRDDRQERSFKPTGGRDRAEDRPQPHEGEPETPTYNLNRYKDNPRIKKTNRKTEEDGTIRLNRFIANAGICSRREADSLIEAGEIKVNGQVVTEMGFKVQPTDTIQYGKKILNREKLVYVLLNKPKDFITTTDDPEGRKTVMSLVANASNERIFPVGRLDRNTTGLLLFTNDGELAQKLTHPSNNVKKIYQVELDKPITKEDFKKIAEGVELEDGKAEVDDVALLGESNKFLGLEIHIGRNRIVRRIFEHLGYEVVTLDRVQYAGLTKKDVPRGNWRYLTEKEVIRLKYFM